MATMPTMHLHQILKPLLDLPPNLVSLDLRMRVNEIPIVTCTYYPEIQADATRAPVTRRFRLEEINEPGPSTAQPPQSP